MSKHPLLSLLACALLLVLLAACGDGACGMDRVAGDGHPHRSAP